MPEPIFHITPRVRWERALAEGSYRAESLDTEGFTHASTREQLPGTVARFYRGQTGLVVLSVDPARLTAPLKWEGSPDSGTPFPHVYGPINLDAVLAVEPLGPAETDP